MTRQLQAIEMLLDGLSKSEVARRMKVSPSRVDQIITPDRNFYRWVARQSKGRCQDCRMLIDSDSSKLEGAVGPGPRGIVLPERDLSRARYRCVNCARKILQKG